MTGEGGAAAPMLRLRGVRRTYGSGHTAVQALRDVSLDVETGQLVALVGRSGSGKTTLLNIVGGLDRPDGGQVVVAGRDVTALDEDGLDALRREVVAFVFQTFGLVNDLTAAENVGLPLRLRRLPSPRASGASSCCWTSWVSAVMRSTGRRRCPAARCSGSRSPGRWPGRRSC